VSKVGKAMEERRLWVGGTALVGAPGALNGSLNGSFVGYEDGGCELSADIELMVR
jgi:hypothetical protein